MAQQPLQQRKAQQFRQAAVDGAESHAQKLLEALEQLKRQSSASRLPQLKKEAQLVRQRPRLVFR